MNSMIELLKDYQYLIATVMVAVISGIFYLIKKGGNHKSQIIKNVKDSQVYQAGDGQNVTKGK